MSPDQVATRLQHIAYRLRLQHKHILAAEIALHGLDPARDEIGFPLQIAAVSELLQHIAQGLDDEAAGILHTAEQDAAA